MNTDTVSIHVDGVTHGGEAVGRLPDGKACFVPYAIPGETVRVRVREDHGRWARAELIGIVDASPDRIDPPCPYFGPEQCGGCQLQHAAPGRQAAMKQRIVTEQLERIGKLDEPPVAETVRVADLGYRTTARFGVDEAGRLGFRRAGSAEVVHIDRCLLLDPVTQATRESAGDTWGDAVEVEVRSARATAEAMLVVHPGAAGLPPLPATDVPVALVDAEGTAHALRGEPVVTERVAGFDFRVSPGSFFQANPAGAEVLTSLVREAADVGPGDAVCDLYAGVGLFSRVLAADGATVAAVEGAPAAAADAEENLAATTASVLHAPVSKALGDIASDTPRGGQPFDVVVLDPPRRGAGSRVCRRIAHLRPRRIVYVSCDPAALARDARILVDAGYDLTGVTPVDQFAQTAQIEAVAVFSRP